MDPAFTKKETEIGKRSCESMQAGMRSPPFEASPSYINKKTARPLMMMPPSCPAPSISSCSSSLQQHMISDCSQKPNNIESNPNPNPNLTPGGTPFAHRYANLTSTADQSQASPHSIPGPNPNPNQNPTLNPHPYPSLNPSTAHPVVADDRYIHGTLSSAKSPLNNTPNKNQRPLHEQPVFDHDHQVGLVSTDDQLFGGFRLLSSHASSPLFSEGLQASWSPMIPDFAYMSTQREAAALMSPAPEITGLGDLQEAEMSLFTNSIPVRRWSIYDESSSRKGLLDRSEVPSTIGAAMDSRTQNYPPTSIIAAENVGNQSPSPSLDGAQFVGRSTANVNHSATVIGAGLSGGESEVMKHASPTTDMSSSSASELQEEESNIAKTVEPEAAYDKLDGGDAPEAEKQEANADNKPSKKPRKKGQRRVREARVALLTKSEVEHLEDGYRWRKYGQKAVKNSPHPRSYYRCTNSKCYVKKRVERCNEDPSLVVTTYEGQHTHHSPAVLRGSHDHMLDPLMSGPLSTLNYHNNAASFMPWQSSLMHPATHFASPSISASLNQLFTRPLHSAPTLLLTKPLSFPTSPFSIPTSSLSNSLSRNPNMPPSLPHGPHRFLPRPHHVIPAGALPRYDQPHLSSPTQPVASTTPPTSSLVDKGLLDDMLSYACGARKPSSSAPS